MSLKLNKNDFFLTGMNSVVVAERHPQADFPSHDHDFDELVIVWRGNGVHIWNDIPYPITCGDLFYINPKTVTATNPPICWHWITCCTAANASGWRLTGSNCCPVKIPHKVSATGA